MPEDRVPDAKTIWLFRERLTKKGIVKQLFHGFEYQLQLKGLAARKGQIVDASFIEAPRQRNTREENKDIKAGITPKALRKTTIKPARKTLMPGGPRRIMKFTLDIKCMSPSIMKTN